MSLTYAHKVLRGYLNFTFCLFQKLDQTFCEKQEWENVAYIEAILSENVVRGSRINDPTKRMSDAGIH